MALPALMEVTVPEGLAEGDALQVQVERSGSDGLSDSEMKLLAGDVLIEVLIPAGVKGGDAMLIVDGVPLSPGGPSGASSGSASSGSASCGSTAVETMTFHTDELREPQPEDGCRFYVGQDIQALGSSGDWTGGAVLEVKRGHETTYRCRLGKDRLEKHLGEDEVRELKHEAGFRFCRGQTVQLRRPSGLLELATVTSNTKLDRSGNGRLEPWYVIRLQPSTTQAEAHVQTVHEEELWPPTPQLGHEFYVGQLLQGARKDGSRVLVRVLEIETVGYRLGYKCVAVNNTAW